MAHGWYELAGIPRADKHSAVQCEWIPWLRPWTTVTQHTEFRMKITSLCFLPDCRVTWASAYVLCIPWTPFFSVLWTHSYSNLLSWNLTNAARPHLESLPTLMDFPPVPTSHMQHPPVFVQTLIPSHVFRLVYSGLGSWGKQLSWSLIS